ncbi:MAG: hypothetical protein ACO3N7_00650 [Kiritimatiellia bacterium]
MKNSLSVLLFSVATLAASTGLRAQSALRGGLVENADVFMFMDIKNMNESAFSKAVEKEQSAEEKALAEEKMAKITAATGLTKEDMLAVAFSMDIDNIDFAAQDPDELEDAQAVIALELAKSVTLEQLKAGLETMGGEGEMQADLRIETVDGIEVIVLESKAAGNEGPDKAFGTLSKDGKTILMAFNTLSLKDALGRIESGTTADPTADMATAMQSIGKRQARMVLVLPPPARQKIQEGIQATAAQGGMGAMLMPFATAKSLLISANTSDVLDFYLSLDLGNAGNAAQAAGMVQSMLPMMMMSMGPQAMELSQKIRIAPEEGVVTVSLKMSPTDIQKMKSAAQGAGMGME